MNPPGPPDSSTRITLVAGAGGGCGSSLLSGAIALSWARVGSTVWLLELDLGRGDRGEAWGLSHDRTLDDLVAVASELDAEHLKRAACAHRSGLTLVLASSRPGATDVWDPPAIGRLLAAARGAAGAGGRVVIDGGLAVSPACSAAAEEADQIVVVCGATLAAARRARHVVTAFSSTAAARLRGLVVSSGAGTSEIGTRALARAVGAPVLGELPWSPGEGERLAVGLWPRGRRRPLVRAVDGLAGVLG